MIVANIACPMVCEGTHPQPLAFPHMMPKSAARSAETGNFRPGLLGVLESVPLFAKVSPDDRGLLARSIEIAEYARGQGIVNQGDEADAMYVIVSGRAKVVMSHDSGREAILSILGPNDFFGEMSLFDDRPRSASVQALEPCRALRLRKRTFLEILRKNPDVAIELIGALVGRLRDANRKIETLALIDVYGRVARLLLDQAKDVDGQLVIPHPLRKTEIADMVGASREMVSRVMSDFEKRGFIGTVNGRIVLLKRQFSGNLRQSGGKSKRAVRISVRQKKPDGSNRGMA